MSSVRKLPNRKKRASKGRAIRVSDLVWDTLNRNRVSSWDVLMRKILGLPKRDGTPQPLVEGILEVTTGKFFLKTPDKSWGDLETDAYEVAILEAAKLKTKRVHKPIRVREI